MKRVAEFLRERNAVDAEIAAIMHRPMTSGIWVSGLRRRIIAETGRGTPRAPMTPDHNSA